MSNGENLNTAGIADLSEQQIKWALMKQKKS